jgi:hypothetical protein
VLPNDPEERCVALDLQIVQGPIDIELSHFRSPYFRLSIAVG